MSAESNDTPEKIKDNENWLSVIAEYARNYTGCPEKERHFSHLSESIKEFSNRPEGYSSGLNTYCDDIFCLCNQTEDRVSSSYAIRRQTMIALILFYG